VPVVVVCVVTLETGYLIRDVDAALEEAVTVHFDSLAVGQPVTVLDIEEVAAGVEGIASCAVTLNGFAATVSVTAAEVAVLTSVSVTT
jgi:predicted oxidoreductase